MHNMAAIQGSILLFTILLFTILLFTTLALTSFESRHDSMDEAQKTSTAWIKQGGVVTVLTPPNENEIKAQ